MMISVPEPLTQLTAFIKPYQRACYWALFSLVVASTNILFLPISLRYLIDYGLSSSKHQIFHFAVVGGITVLSACSIAWRHYLFSWISERVVTDMRKKIFSRVIRLDMVQFESIQLGEILSRLHADTAVLQQILGTSISMSLRNLIQLTGAFSMLLVTSFHLTMIFLATAPILLFPGYRLLRKLRTLSRDGQDKIARASVFATESLQSVQVVQAFAHEAQDISDYHNLVESAFDAQQRRIQSRSLMTALIVLGVAFSFLCVAWYAIGLEQTNTGMVTQGVLFQFVAYAIVFSGSVVGVSDLVGDVQRVLGASERLSVLLRLTASIRSPINPFRIARPISGLVEFRDVCFTYPNRASHIAISQVSMRVLPGQTVAIVGASGAGKTTILQLLLRFYEIDTGQISIDGVSVNQFSLNDLRQMVSLVPQEVTIFSGTIADNIRYGCPNASKQQILAASKSALVDPFVRQLPEGYNTEVGERGVRLSGGQKQRIAIARAFLRDSPILLLDEATSHLDSENEYHLHQALSRLIHGRTTIIVAHRLSTILKADQIIVLHQGQIIDQGSHLHLMESCAYYAQLSHLQNLGA
ncbi:MAG: ABC transporter [Legionellales bacterium]|nr:ABC transporter [Legionellales bacterium]